MTTIADAREQWSPAGVYLNTASYGLPPRDGFDAMQAALADWRGGRTSWEHWGESTEGARAAWAQMVGVAPERVAIGATVSAFTGLIAASLPDGASVVVPDVEFTSTLFPFLVQERRGVTVTTVPPERLAEAIDASHRRRRVQRRADEHRRGRRPRRDRRRGRAPRRADAARRDAGLRLAADRRDALRRRRLQRLQVADRAARHGLDGDRRRRGATTSCPTPPAGTPAPTCTPATSARRCGWPPTRAGSTPRRRGFRGLARSPALELLNRIGIAAVYEHDVALANRFRAGLGMRAVQQRDRVGRRARTGPSGSSGRASSPRCAAVACARRGICTTPTPTSTPRSTRWRIERRPAA